MTAEIIPFRRDAHAMLREDIVACLAQDDRGVTNVTVEAANNLARWLLRRPNGAVRQLMDDHTGGAA